MNRWLGRLINRRLALWFASLAVIAVLLAALGAIFWQTRMKATYEVEAKFEPDKETILVQIPREPFQKIVQGDLVEIEGRSVPGLVVSLADRGDTIEAKIDLLLSEKPGPNFQFPPRVRITLRARRLIAAFRRGG